MIAGIIFLVIVAIGGRLVKTQTDLTNEVKALQSQTKVLIEENTNLKKQIEEKQKEFEALKLSKAEVKKVSVVKATVKPDCESYRGLLSKYDWDVNTALLVMSKESGCRVEANSPTNDHGLFQLHDQDVHDPQANIEIAYGKYFAGRVGERNWSAWYAVCTPGNSPQPKYAGVKCS